MRPWNHAYSKFAPYNFGVSNHGEDTAVTAMTEATPIAFPSLSACIVVIHDAERECVCKRVDLVAETTRIGREASADLVLDREKISRRHARIETSDRGSVLIDERSTNGTFVNEQRVLPDAPYVLRSGDRIRLGRIILRYFKGDDIERQYQEEIFQLTEYDPMTELRSRRYFEDALRCEVNRAHRYERPLSSLSLDIDNFKLVNDTFGHEGGDEVLRAVARCLRAATGRTEVAARLSGDEMAILLPETMLSDALVLAERVRAMVEETVITVDERQIRVTLSIGCAALGHGEDAASLVRRCDAKLYEAKDGRNRVRS